MMELTYPDNSRSMILYIKYEIYCQSINPTNYALKYGMQLNFLIM